MSQNGRGGWGGSSSFTPTQKKGGGRDRRKCLSHAEGGGGEQNVLTRVHRVLAMLKGGGVRANLKPWA